MAFTSGMEGNTYQIFAALNVINTPVPILLWVFLSSLSGSCVESRKGETLTSAGGQKVLLTVFRISSTEVPLGAG